MGSLCSTCGQTTMVTIFPCNWITPQRTHSYTNHCPGGNGRSQLGSHRPTNQNKGGSRTPSEIAMIKVSAWEPGCDCRTGQANEWTLVTGKPISRPSTDDTMTSRTTYTHIMHQTILPVITPASTPSNNPGFPSLAKFIPAATRSRLQFAKYL